MVHDWLANRPCIPTSVAAVLASSAILAIDSEPIVIHNEPQSTASIAELSCTAATDVGMHGLLASQSCTILCYPLVYVHCGPVVDFFITKQTSLHPFDFVRNLFHLLYKLHVPAQSS